MKTYLVIEAVDEQGTKLSVKGARLIDDRGQLSETFADHPVRGMSLDLSTTTLGEFRLHIDLDHHPVLVFNARLVERKGVREFEFVKPTPLCITVASKRASAGDSSSPTLTTLTLVVAQSHEEIVLVAGWGYQYDSDMTLFAKTFRDDQYRGKTNVVRSSSKVLKDVTIARCIHPYTRVTLFDFRTGHRVRWIKGQSGWHEIDSYLQGTVPTHRGKYNDADNADKRSDDDSISITHVYHYIIRLGYSHPNSVIGFHIFSHAWSGGPILVNTIQRFPYGDRHPQRHLRDPEDKDGRTKDFSLDNMPEIDKFKAAFRRDAHVKIWGCLYTYYYIDLIKAALKAREAKLTDDEPFDFVAGGESQRASHADIVAELRSGLAGSYMGNLARAIDLEVYGAPPGLGSNIASIKGKSYMYVDQERNAKTLAWLEDELGLVPDQTGYLPYD